MSLDALSSAAVSMRTAILRPALKACHSGPRSRIIFKKVILRRAEIQDKGVVTSVSEVVFVSRLVFQEAQHQSTQGLASLHVELVAMVRDLIL